MLHAVTAGAFTRYSSNYVEQQKIAMGDVCCVGRPERAGLNLRTIAVATGAGSARINRILRRSKLVSLKRNAKLSAIRGAPRREPMSRSGTQQNAAGLPRRLPDGLLSPQNVVIYILPW